MPPYRTFWSKTPEEPKSPEFKCLACEKPLYRENVLGGPEMLDRHRADFALCLPCCIQCDNERGSFNRRKWALEARMKKISLAQLEP